MTPASAVPVTNTRKATSMLTAMIETYTPGATREGYPAGLKLGEGTARLARPVEGKIVADRESVKVLNPLEEDLGHGDFVRLEAVYPQGREYDRGPAISEFVVCGVVHRFAR